MSALKPATDDEREQMAGVLAALQQVIGGFASLRFPVARVLAALCWLTGLQAALTLRTVDDLLEGIEAGQRAAADLAGRPPPVPFRPDAPRQVGGLQKVLVSALAQVSAQRSAAGSPVATQQVIAALSFLVGQVSTLVEISPEALRALLQAGVNQGQSQAGQAQADIARFHARQARQRGRRS